MDSQGDRGLCGCWSQAMAQAHIFLRNYRV